MNAIILPKPAKTPLDRELKTTSILVVLTSLSYSLWDYCILFIIQSQNHHHCNQGLTKKNIDLGHSSLLHNPWCCKSMAHSKLSTSSLYLQVPCNIVLHSHFDNRSLIFNSFLVYYTASFSTQKYSYPRYEKSVTIHIHILHNLNIFISLHILILSILHNLHIWIPFLAFR